MRYGIAKRLEFIVRFFQFAGSFLYALLQVGVETAKLIFTVTQCAIAIVDPVKHLIERFSQHDEFAISGARGTDGIVATIGNGPGSISQSENRLRNLPLETTRQSVSQ